MRGRSFIFFIGGLTSLVLLFSGSHIFPVAHGTCSLSRIAYIPAAGEDDTEAVLISHSHLASQPAEGNYEPHRIHVRGLHRTFSSVFFSSLLLKSNPIDASSLAAPPRYISPDCVYAQHNYLFRLTPF